MKNRVSSLLEISISGIVIGGMAMAILLGLLTITNPVYAQPMPIVRGIQPPPGAVDVPPNTNIIAHYSTSDPAGFEWCFDSVFVGIVEIVGVSTESLFVDDVVLDYTDWPDLRVIYDRATDYPLGSTVNAHFIIVDCDSNIAEAITSFDVSMDSSGPSECEPTMLSVEPHEGMLHVPFDHPVDMVFGAVDPMCPSMCWDTSSFWGGLIIDLGSEPPDTILLDIGDVDFSLEGPTNLNIHYIHPGGWPTTSEAPGTRIRGLFAVSDCDSTEAEGTFEFFIDPDSGSSPECHPEFYGVIPVLGAMDVPVDAGINIVFGPFDTLVCDGCWDTLSFMGEIIINDRSSAEVDTVELNHTDVDFWLDHDPFVRIGYHHTSDWPNGADISGRFGLEDCDSNHVDGEFFFMVVADSTPSASCDISFYHAEPIPGASDIPPDRHIRMSFGPMDPMCTDFCIDTSSFEGVVHVETPTGVDTIMLVRDDVAFDFSEWPDAVIIDYFDVGWPIGAQINANFALSDCEDNRANGETFFFVEDDSIGPIDCNPIVYETYPRHGAGDVPISAAIDVVFGPADTLHCDGCWDTLRFSGELFIHDIAASEIDTVELDFSDVEFWFGRDPSINIEYYHSEEWPYGSEVYGKLSIVDCDSNYVETNVSFSVVEDSSSPGIECEIAFYHAEPMPGTHDVELTRHINMAFGPRDPICDDFCVDTSSFEGVIHIETPSGIDTTYIGMSDVEFDFSEWPDVVIVDYFDGDWPMNAHVNAMFAFSDCDSGRAIGETFFTTEGDTIGPIDCHPEVFEVMPDLGAYDVPVDAGINVVFGPYNTLLCDGCWDTLSFIGVLVISDPSSASTDTIELHHDDVEFWLGDAPFIGIEYHHDTEWPLGVDVNGHFLIKDCDSITAIGTILFSVIPDTSSFIPCDISFYSADPYPGTHGVSRDGHVRMDFGPLDPMCVDFCVDTSSFEGVVHVTSTSGIDTIFLAPGDVEFDYSEWPDMIIVDYFDADWPFNAQVHALFALSDCDSNRAVGETHFQVETDSSGPGDCLPVFYWVDPEYSEPEVPVDAPINMVFGPEDTVHCDGCWDTLSFVGRIEVHDPSSAEMDTIFLHHDDVNFWLGHDPFIRIEYIHDEDWPNDAEIAGEFAILNCDSMNVFGDIRFTVAPDTTTPPIDCDINLLYVQPSSGSYGIERDSHIRMAFGPMDPMCDEFCIDTSSFEGVVHIETGTGVDTLELGLGDVFFDYMDWPNFVIIDYLDGDWPFGSQVHAIFALSDCDSNRTNGETFFTVETDSGGPIDCSPEFLGVTPYWGAMHVPIDEAIKMQFGPIDPACTTMCWDTLAFHGFLIIMSGGTMDSVVLDYSDVNFSLSDYPNIEIEYNHPGGWSYDTQVEGHWVMVDCDSNVANGGILFNTIPDSGGPSVCEIEFYYSEPTVGSMGIPVEENIIMHFGPADSICDSFCVDTSTFEGVLHISSGQGMPADTIFLGIGDVDFDFSEWPMIGIIYDHPTPWPYDMNIGSYFAISDCDDNRARGENWFRTEYDTSGSPDCYPEFVTVSPPSGAMHVPIGAPINMVFGPESPSCTTMCWDTLMFRGTFVVMHGGVIDTVVLDHNDVEFSFDDYPNIGIEYHHPGGWPYDAEVEGGWLIADCDSNLADGGLYFHTVSDSGFPPICDIIFYSVSPSVGAMDIPIEEDIVMHFGPADTSCDSFCVDTSTFEGVLHLSSGPGMPADTIFLGVGDVDFDFSEWPTIGIIYDHPTPWPYDMNIDSYFAISDCDDNRAHGETFFSTEPDTSAPPEYDITWLVPPHPLWTACEDQEIIYIIEPEVPDSLIMHIGSDIYDLTDDELTVVGDTVIFEPPIPWENGDSVFIGVLGDHAHFGVDLSSPVMYPVLPGDGGMVPVDSPVVHYHIHDIYSGLDTSSITLAVMVNGSSVGTYVVGDMGVYYFSHMIHLDILEAGIIVDSGDSVTIFITASDNTTPDYCGPNTRIEDLHFTVGGTEHERILYGMVTDSVGTGLEDMRVRLFHYLGGPVMADWGRTETESDGSFEMTVFPGVYSLGVFDPWGEYRPVFYENRRCLLESDPIFVRADTDSVNVGNLIMHPSPIVLYSVGGSILEVDDGPIDAAYVVAISSEEDEIMDAVITDSTGLYELTLPVGEYYILGFHDEYIPGFYGGSIEWPSATTVNVSGDMDDLDIELLPMYMEGDAILSGEVSVDTMDVFMDVIPLRGVRLYLMDVTHDKAVYMALSDYQGNYQFEGVDAGTYRLRADKNGYTCEAGYYSVSLDSVYSQDVRMNIYTGVQENTPLRAASFEIIGINPNPFNAACAINYSVDNAGDFSVDVYDVSGRHVESLYNGNLEKGEYVTIWNPQNISTGMYMVKISSGQTTRTCKALLIK